MASLWGKAFEIDSSTEKTKSILTKISKPKKVITDPDKILKSKTVSIESKLSIIRDRVNKILGKYSEQTQVIRDKQTLIEYINCAIKNGEIAIDTETNNSLDPLTCKLMGPCIYTPGQKSAYIPINHVDTLTNDLLLNQLTEKDIKEEFSKLIDAKTKIIMHNGKFDYKVFACTCDLELPIYWDTMIGAKVLDENESAALKYQYMVKIDPSQEKYSIDKLFENIQYAEVEPELFALYAATDAYLTYKLYQYQVNEFNKPGNEKLFNLFKTVEMPLVPCIAKMELTGVCIDIEYSKRLSTKYHNKLEETNKLIDKELENLSEQIEKWKSNTSNKNVSKLSNPINLDSPTQLAILLYDILKIPPQSTKSPRGTGEDILKKINNPLCNLVLERRGILKLLNTYIDKLPYCLSPRDNRLHGEFLQFGADTGRFSSKNPNLQNIPAREESIRMMFTASPGYVMIGSDYS